MSDIFYDTTGSFSALTPKKIVAGAYNPTITYNAVDALNTARYQAFTPSEGGTCTGVVVCIKNTSDVAANTITVQLQKNDGGWGDVAGAVQTRTVENIAGAHTNTIRFGPAWVYFELGTPAVITTDADTWRIKISSSTASQLIYQTYGYAIVISGTTTYSANDNIIIKEGIVLTQDQSITATNLVLGVNTHWLVPSTVAASYGLTTTNLWFSKDCRIALGEDDTHRIPYANKFTLTVTNWKNGDGYQTGQNYEFEMWGEKPTNYFTKLAASLNNGQKVLTTTDDMSASWVNGETLIVSGRYSATYHGYESMVLDTITTTTINTTLNFASPHYKDWVVVNATRAIQCGIELSCGTIAYSYTSWAVVKLSGVYVSSLNSQLYFLSGSGPSYDTTRYTTRHLDTIIMSNGAGVSINDIYVPSAIKPNLYSPTFKNVFMWGGSSSKNSNGFEVSSVNRATISDIYISTPNFLYGGLVKVDGVQCTLTDIQTSGTYIGGYPHSYYTLTSCTITRLKAMGCGHFLLGLISYGSTFNNCTFDNGLYGIYTSGSIVNTRFNSCNFGQDYANATNDFYFVAGSYQQSTCVNCKFTPTKEVGNIANGAGGSFVKADTYGTTANDHRSWWQFGNSISTGTGLTDTTAHTAGGFAIRFEPLSSTDSHEWEFTIPTGNIQNKTMMVGVWCKINSATYYAGTHQLPRLTIDYDNGTTAYVQASETTDWQFLPLPFTPTTTYGQITVTLSARTDATTTDAYVYWDDFKTLYPAESPLNTQTFDLWADALPVTPPIATVLSANDVWSASSAVDYGTNTMGKWVKKLLDKITFWGTK